MKLVVPKRRDLYRTLIFVIIALMAVFYFTPKISRAEVAGVSGAAPGTGSTQGRLDQQPPEKIRE